VVAPVEVPAPAPVPAEVPEEVPVTEEVPVPAPAPAPVQTIVVDTEPSVRFTNIDSVFHHSDPEQNIMSEVNTIENDYDEDTLQFVDAPPTGLDGDYEELS
jgi:hypothetical protein